MSEPANVAPHRRPGGGTAQFRQAVHRAVPDVISEGRINNVGILEISRRLRVHDGSVNRRRRMRENLVLDVMLTMSERELSLPDAGSPQADLTGIATDLIAYLYTPRGHGLTRALIFVSDSKQINDTHNAFWDRRYRADGVMIARVARRGELPPDTDAGRCSNC
ncbi:TetR-like C-terminal domain-containing protein [Nocardia terrae]|uniref:TetR-like C-terminal domain-containing protein n=1 Tax=Nocardia terrae TaxID=2675851 RepID=UPI0012F84A67|nr:TetR-like C-terminal domain-containing protein [Nocardia terrae]